MVVRTRINEPGLVDLGLRICFNGTPERSQVNSLVQLILVATTICAPSWDTFATWAPVSYCSFLSRNAVHNSPSKGIMA